VYEAAVTAPAAWAPNGPTSQGVTLGSASAASASFGFQARGSVGGVVFQDLDGDASQRHDEPGISSVTVQVLQQGVPLAQAVTDSSGSYLFTGLTPGAYTLRVSLPTGIAAVTPSDRAIVLADGGAVNASFGLQPLNTIAGVVFVDLNGDGQRQNGENGLGSVPLTLYTAGADGLFFTADDVLAAATASAGSGAYQFLNQPANAYAVRMTAPAGYTPTTPSSVVVNLAQFGAAAANFGLQWRNSVAATIFEDVNGNGIQEAGEPPLSGQQVSLEAGDGRATSAVFTATTTSAGFVVFRSLPEGAYVLRTATPGLGYFAVRTLAYITLQPAGAVSEAFGYRRTGAVAGAVFDDVDGNGQRTTGEPGLSGLQVLLLSQDGAVVATAATAADGSYSFQQLAAAAINCWRRRLPATPPPLPTPQPSPSPRKARTLRQRSASALPRCARCTGGSSATSTATACRTRASRASPASRSTSAAACRS
jgi:hypothetical protein